MSSPISIMSAISRNRLSSTGRAPRRTNSSESTSGLSGSPMPWPASACVLVTCLFAGRWFSARAGLISGLILMTSFGFFAMARIVTIDMLFSFLLFASLSCFYEFYRERRRLFLYLSWAALALAVLAKGPVAPVLLGATVVLFLWSEKNLRFLKEAASPRALLLFAVIAVSLVRPHGREGEGILSVLFHRPARPQISDDKAQQVRPSLLLLPCLVRGPVSLVDIHSQGRYPLLAKKRDAAAPYLVPRRFRVLQRVGLEAAPLYPPPFPRSFDRPRLPLRRAVAHPRAQEA